MSTVSGTPTEDAGSRRDNDTGRLYASLGPLPSPTGRPALIVLSGLPGSGKSYFCRELAALVPSLVMLETDALRRVLFPEPKHTPPEHGRLFRNVHRLLERLLLEGHVVAYDATNLVRRHRRSLYNIAERVGAERVIVELTAPERLIRRRLAQRMSDIEAGRAKADNSAAGVDVYLRLRRNAQPIRRDHITIDTSRDITSALNKVVAQLQQSNKATARDGI